MREYKYAQSDETLLITGPTGTGKSRMAKIIHDRSKRVANRFIHVNLCNFSDGLFESELFGHTKGSFTGATSDKAGFLEKVGSGTLFLDELGEISLKTQAKLLMLLEEKKFYPVGSTVPLGFRGRLVFATNKNLEAMVKSGSFREDLYFRLRTFELELSSLIDLPDFEDIVEREFLTCKLKKRKSALILSDEARSVIQNYDWPGNYRELLNVLNYIVLMSDNCVVENDFPSYMLRNSEPGQNTDDYHANLSRFEKHFLKKMLEKRDYRINKTARETKISKVTLLAKIKKYDIKVVKEEQKRQKA